MFSRSSDVRYTLENAPYTGSEHDQAIVKQGIASGESREVGTAEFLWGDHFEGWYELVQQTMRKLVG